MLSLSTPRETKGFIGERFDSDAGLSYLNARYYDPKLAMFIQPDWWEVTESGVGTNRYAYSFNDPVNGKDTGGNVTTVTDKGDNDLFSLNDGKEEETRITSQEAYDAGIHWMEEDADNFMELLDISPSFASHPGVKHFTWGDIASFAEIDRTAIIFRSGMAGDWKASPDGADGYRLSDVEGTPYWSDALGQIPFAADTYRGYRTQGYSHAVAARLTIRRGSEFADGSVLKGLAGMLGLRAPDSSNSYDNAMIKHVVDRAEVRWSVKVTYAPEYSNVYSIRTNLNHDYRGLSFR
ncbi:MAG: RHS repeat-associated core domain-containing protein [Albidovulum sp.]|uniref:RHS repeat-associated core domain-containing protein n=1 Tax=Albidovulum sp. TaxID=1872424 RepID=UPI003CA0D905